MTARFARRSPLSVSRRHLTLALVAVILLIVLPPVVPAHAAADFVLVTSPDDRGGVCPSPNQCTLRDALDLAAPDATITFNFTGAIALDSTLTLTKNVTIRGPGASLLALDGQDAIRVLTVDGNVEVTLDGMTVRRGSLVPRGDGAGVWNNGGVLTIKNSIVTDNHGGEGGSPGGKGGGISNDGGTLLVQNSVVSGNSVAGHDSPGGGIYNNAGTLTVESSTISGNATDSSGGGISNSNGAMTVMNSAIVGNTSRSVGGGIATLNSIPNRLQAVVNSTITSNTASGYGGGVFASVGVLSVTNSTLSGNSAPTGGGIMFAPYGAEVRLRNSIVVENTTGDNCGQWSASQGATSLGIVSQGNNLGDSFACFPAQASLGDIVTSDTLLGPLADNGGPTQTRALLNGSAAIDGVKYLPTDCGTTITSDQRGILRPQDRAAVRCDIGAFELSGGAPIVFQIGPQVTEEDTPTRAIGISLVDANTPATLLTLTGSSSDPVRVPDGNLVFSGSGYRRTLVVTPAPNQFGYVEIRVRVSDGAESSETAFPLTINPGNDAPVNTVPGPQTVDVGTALVFNGPRLVSVSDPDAGTSTVRVALSVAHGKLTLASTAALVITNGENDTPSMWLTGSVSAVNTALNGMRYTPAVGFIGSDTLTIDTSDLGHTGNGGPLRDTDTIDISVAAPHTPPTISTIPDQSIDLGGSSATVPFTVNSAVVAPANLVVTATSSNTVLLPAASLLLGGSGSARTIRITPAPGQSGEATLDVKVSDGTAEAHTTFTVTVLRVNQIPTAVNDSYTGVSGQTLSVPAVIGVLQNDSDPEQTPLRARSASGPSHGTLQLNPDGSFTYSPTAGFTGADSFTYLASDGEKTSSAATVTVTVAVNACVPRPGVQTTPTAGGGKLTVRVEATPLNTRANNPLQQIKFGDLQNAKVTLGGKQIASGEPYAVPAGSVSVTFTVERERPGLATTVPFGVVDGCGTWQTFVGGGAGAGF